MNPIRTLLWTGGLAVALAGASGDARAPFGATLGGYTARDAAEEASIEARFMSGPTAKEERASLRELTAEPHPAGSARNHALAEYVADTWRRQGLEHVVIHRYDVLNSSPRSIALEMIAPVHYVAGLREASYDVDPDTRNPRVRGGWVSMSASGDVTAPLVYAHGGNPEDYEVLAKNGIDVRGKIVLVRYSNPYSYRGYKALLAERHGAAGLLIYSDPAEDGYRPETAFPNGPRGPATHIQRGSITYDFIVPGDPLTPGWASVAGAKRIDVAAAESVPKIMATVISWHDAQPLLEHIGGPEAPAEWQGGLPIKYHLGGEARVHFKADMDTSVQPIEVVEARIDGAEFPDEWIVLGNHRDAWEFGAVDPSSGTAALLGVSRALGHLLKSGVRPRRTLILCSWDAEEVALTGSTEWGEEFAEDLRRKLVAYLNVDEGVSGPHFDVSAVPSLAPLLVDVSRSVPDPSGRPLYSAWREAVARHRAEAHVDLPVRDDNLVETKIPGSSDDTVFLSFLVRPTMTAGFAGDDYYPSIYHSAYDDFYWMEHFGDPGFRYHVAMSQFWGVTALRLANADLLPLDFGRYGHAIGGFIDELDKRVALSAHVDLAGLRQAAADFARAGEDLQRASRIALDAGHLDVATERRINEGLLAVEGSWLDPAGMPHRPWYKHMIYAKRYNYDPLQLPGITEAAEESDFDTAQVQVATLERALRGDVTRLRSLIVELATRH
ncbi:MAG TPA: M28 family metallopeptidase [Steroidobacteraceae bacterium]|nr:M28 family metallopeptidase [Steroidobacteraceae bacterium]